MYDFTIIGAGIVGLSAAYKLSLAHPEARVQVLEKERDVALHQTGRNSGVIHSGIYYKPGSYRALNCVNGRHQLVDFCREHEVAMEITGKVIVAVSDEELPRLKAIYERGLQNEIEGVRLIDRKELAGIEPHVAGVGAVHVPCAGIVDYTGMSTTLKKLIEERGGKVSFFKHVDALRNTGDSVEVFAGNEYFKTRFVVNCAGLYSDHVARAAGIKPPVQIVPFRGEYFELTPEAEYLVKSLVYPLPNPEFPFLGVHFTRMVLGGVECGPNAVFAFEREGYEKLGINLNETIETVNFPGFWKLAFKHWRMGIDEYRRSLSKEAFLRGLQGLIPAVKLHQLKPAPSGVRAMALLPSGEILDDFHFEVIERQVHVLNAPSPAATACLAIGDEIVKRMCSEFDLE